MYETIAWLVNVKHARHLTNLIWISVGMLRSKSIALSKIANAIPGESDAESRVTEIRRWLTAPDISIWKLYEPIVKHMLQGWQEQAVTLILDGSMVYGERLPWGDVPQIFRLSLIHGPSKGHFGNRAIALSWRVLASPGVTTPHRLSRMLQRAARREPRAGCDRMWTALRSWWIVGFATVIGWNSSEKQTGIISCA